MYTYYSADHFCEDVGERYDDYEHIARTVAVGLEYLIEHDYEVYDFVDLIVCLDKQHTCRKQVESFRQCPEQYGLRHMTFEEIADTDIPF